MVHTKPTTSAAASRTAELFAIVSTAAIVTEFSIASDTSLRPSSATGEALWYPSSASVGEDVSLDSGQFLDTMSLNYSMTELVLTSCSEYNVQSQQFIVAYSVWYKLYLDMVNDINDVSGVESLYYSHFVLELGIVPVQQYKVVSAKFFA